MADITWRRVQADRLYPIYAHTSTGMYEIRMTPSARFSFSRNGKHLGNCTRIEDAKMHVRIEHEYRLKGATA